MERMINGRMSMLAMEKARLAAEKASTAAGRSRGGWVRLARLESFTGREVEPYVVAVRAVASEFMPVQLGCSCPDYRFRRAAQGTTCKHIREFLGHAGGSSPAEGIWLYRAGGAFASSIQHLEVPGNER